MIVGGPNQSIEISSLSPSIFCPGYAFGQWYLSRNGNSLIEQ